MKRKGIRVDGHEPEKKVMETKSVSLNQVSIQVYFTVQMCKGKAVERSA